MKVNEVMLTNKQGLKKTKLLYIIVSLNYFHFPQNKKAYSTVTKKIQEIGFFYGYSQKFLQDWIDVVI